MVVRPDARGTTERRVGRPFHADGLQCRRDRGLVDRASADAGRLGSRRGAGGEPDDPARVDALILPFRETFSAVFFVGLGSYNAIRYSHRFRRGIPDRRRTDRERPSVEIGRGSGRTQAHGAQPADRIGNEHRPFANGRVLIRHYWQTATTWGFLLRRPTTRFLSSAWERSCSRRSCSSRACVSLNPEWLSKRHRPSRARVRSRRSGTTVVVGLGPIGSQAVSRLELAGIDVHLIDFNPLNLQPFAQLGFTHGGRRRRGRRNPPPRPGRGVPDCGRHRSLRHDCRGHRGHDSPGEPDVPNHRSLPISGEYRKHQA